MAGESPSRAWDEEMEVEEISRGDEEECSLPIVGREELAAMISPSADAETEEMSSSAASVEENLPAEVEAEFSTPIECALESNSGEEDALQEENSSATETAAATTTHPSFLRTPISLHNNFPNSNNSAKPGGNASNSNSSSSNSSRSSNNYQQQQ